MKNILSFCLWGKDYKYVEGLQANVRQAAQFYPGWEVVVFAAYGVPPVFIESLRKQGVTVICRSRFTDPVPNPMFWRFEVADWHPGRKFIIRDADSRLSNRERIAVEDWLSSGIPFHVMHDHPHHQRPIMGGMWGGTCGVLRDIRPQSAQWFGKREKDVVYGADQDFLESWALPQMAAAGILSHELWTDRGDEGYPFPHLAGEAKVTIRPFPDHPIDEQVDFVGEVFDQFGKPRLADRAARSELLQLQKSSAEHHG